MNPASAFLKLDRVNSAIRDGFISTHHLNLKTKIHA
jgi:hypothetical protein